MRLRPLLLGGEIMAYLTTYICDCDDMVLDKSNHLSIVNNNVEIKFKNETSMVNPVLLLSPSIGLDWNYAYIDDFGYFYYLKDRSYSNGYMVVTLEIDPRMSFHSEIENLNVIANRCSSRYNLYQIDNKIPKLQKDLIQTQPFRGGFGGASFILAVNGG